MPRRHALWVALLLIVLTTGCRGAPIKPEQSLQNALHPLTAGAPVGQSFSAHFDGLQAIAIYLHPQAGGQGRLRLRLYQDAGKGQLLRTALLPAAQLDQPGYYRFNFDPLPDTRQKDYYFELSLLGSGALQVGAAEGAAYLNGALYQDSIPQNRQTTFALGYAQRAYYLGLLREALDWLGWLALAAWLFLLPGWVLLAYSWPGWAQRSLWARVGLALGVGLAIYPVLMLLGWLTNLRLGAGFAWLPPLAALAAVLWRGRAHLTGGRHAWAAAWRVRRAAWPGWRAWLRSQLRPAGMQPLVSAVIVALIVFSRLWAIRTLDFPLWGDSYQHSMITQLMLDYGGIFHTWLPYAELSSFTYHFGFHSQAAVFAWLSGLPSPQATLVMGQLINIAAVLTLFPLAAYLGRSPWAGTAAIALAGLFSPMPMFYTNWGRYTQLAGQAILPVLLLLLWIIARRARLPLARAELAWLCLGGLALTHYRILILVVLFYPLALLLQAPRRDWLRRGLRLAWASLGGGLLFLPWFIHVYSGQIMTIVNQQLTHTQPGPASLAEAASVIGDPALYYPLWLWLLAPPAVLLLFSRRSRLAWALALWAGLQVLLANPNWLKLPGSGVVDNFAVFIAMYIPLSLLLGAGALQGVHSLRAAAGAKQRSEWPLAWAGLGWAAVLAIVAVSGLWLARQQTQRIQPAQFALATRPDLRAMQWVQANTAPEARFVVNSLPAYGGYIGAGSDGGWWLPLMTGRLSTQPPINYGNEQGLSPDFRVVTVKRVNALLDTGLNDAALRRSLYAEGYRYVYIGQQQGRVNSAVPMLDPAVLQSLPGLKMVYHQDRVWIFELTP